jgi:hypothetical protein
VASKKRDIDALLAQAAAQGFTYRKTGGNHWRVTAPPGVSGPSGTEVVISCTPSSVGAVKTSEADLRRIGFRLQGRPPKKKRKLQSDAETVAPAPPVVFSSPQAPVQEGTTMARIADVARVSGGTLRAPAEPQEARFIKTEEILPNLALAAAWVHSHILEDVMKGEVQREVQLGGVWGWEWTGSRQGMIGSIWPNLPKVDYSITPPAMSEEQRRIAMWLSQSGNMAPLESGSARQKTVWWVSKQWIEVSTDFVNQRNGKPNWWEERVTLAEAGETRKPQPVTVTHTQPTAPPPAATAAAAVAAAPRTPANGQQPIDPGITIYRCTLCSYESVSNRSLGTHNGRLGDKPHPTGRFPCPVTTCREVRPDVDALGSHLSKDHRDLGLEICRTCGNVSKNRTDRIDHQMRMHEDAYKHRPAPGGALAFAQGVDEFEMGSQTPAPRITPPPPDRDPLLIPFQRANQPVPEPAAAAATAMPAIPPIDGSDALSSLQRILLDAEQARARASIIPSLQARLEKLEGENKELRERDRQIAEWLRNYPFLGDTNK